ncbi:MAG: radical SAM protein, partial [Candidatus Methanomethylicia archaeon]
MKIIILDGYTDEPAGLGVPPYLDVYPRYVAGAIWTAEKNADIRYFTIDDVRRDTGRFIEQALKSDLVILIAGVCVPGRYLGGDPIKPWEITRLARLIEKPIKIIGGPVAQFGLGVEGGKVVEPPEFSDLFDIVVKGDIEVVVYRLIKEKSIEKIDPFEKRPSQKFISKFATRGAEIITQHPCYKLNLICEVETYRGCPRAIIGGCSFCIEPLKGLPDFRPVKDIVEEIKALYSYGVRFIRLGRQPDFFTYNAENIGEVEF